MNTKGLLFWVLALVMLESCQVAAAADDSTARREVETAIAAMGGKAVLASIHTLAFDAVGHRNMLEQSLRPEGPWWQDYFQLSEIRDFTTRSERVSHKHRGYSSPDWWLQHKQWDSDPYYPTYVVADGAVAQIAKGEYARSYSAYLQNAEEDFAFGPLGLLRTALSADDLHTLPEVRFHGIMHRVVAFTWNGYPVRVYLNSYSGLPEAVEWTRPRPYDVFWNVWGDVTTRIAYGMWALQPDGLRYPRQWTTERNGLPVSDLSITSVTVNATPAADAFAIPADVKKAYLAHKRTIDELPLGVPGKPAAEIEPGVVHIPGAWNVNLIRQRDGIVVLEGPISSAYSVKVLNEARERFPGLPVKAVIATSDSWPHIGGMREYAARGIPIYTLALDRAVLKRLFRAPHGDRPDDLQEHPRAPKWHLITKRTALGSGTNRLELLPYRTKTAERQMLVYFPNYKLLYTSDLFAPNTGKTWFTPEYLLEVRNVVARERLEVNDIFGMHYGVTPWKTVMAALGTFLSSTPKQAAAEPTELASDLRPLSVFEGRWSCTGKFLKSGKSISSTETFSAAADGHWLRMRHDDNPPHSFRAVEMWGYDGKAKQFSMYAFDNFSGVRHYTSPGWQAEKLVWSNASGAGTPADRFVFEQRGSGGYRFTYAVQRDGKHWAEVDSLVCQR